MLGNLDPWIHLCRTVPVLCRMRVAFVPDVCRFCVGIVGRVSEMFRICQICDGFVSDVCRNCVGVVSDLCRSCVGAVSHLYRMCVGSVDSYRICDGFALDL